MIKDKSWFPYKTKSDIIYKTINGLIDSLYVAQIDSSIWEHGTECVEYDERRNCEIRSNRFNDFNIQITLNPFELSFAINNFGKLISLYYCTTCSKPSNYPHELNLIDSINFNNVIHHDILILTDSTKDFEIYYSRLGILRYIINKDTFEIVK